MNPGVGMPQHTMGGTAGPLGIGDQAQGAATDPMNALQNLARQGGQPPQQGRALLPRFYYIDNVILLLLLS